MEQSVVRNPDLIDTLQRYADLFTFAPVACVVLSEDGRVDDANRVAASTLGWPRSWIVGQLFSRWIVKQDLQRFLRHLSSACHSDTPITGEFRIEDRHGIRRELRFDSVGAMPRDADPLDGDSRRGRRCQMTLVETDGARAAPARAKAGMRDDLAHTARLGSCADMAAALVHELSQPLGSIALYCGASIRRLNSGDMRPGQLSVSLENVAAAAMSAASTVRSLRSLLGRNECRIELLDVSEVVRNAARLAEPYARNHGARILLRLAGELAPVRADRIQLQQVLLNVLQNSIDAMQDAGCENRLIAINTDKPSMFAVRVTIADMGPGMTEQQQRRAFDPFYSTKSTGAGLGLPISRMIVESYGGRLWAAPGAHRGTRISLTLPPVHEHD